MSSRKQAPWLLPVVAAVAIFLVLIFIVKKMTEFFNTESPVMDETSKKILNDQKLTEEYYQAIESEKNGKAGKIIVDGEEYQVLRAGKFSNSVQ